MSDFNRRRLPNFSDQMKWPIHIHLPVGHCHGNEVESKRRNAAACTLRSLSDRLPPPARGTILGDLHAYLTDILDREWSDMQRRKESEAADARFQLLWQTVETVNMDPPDNQIRGQLLSLLATAHQSRETRLFQMRQGVPGLVWSLLIVFTSGLVGCLLVFAEEASLSKDVLVGVFTSSLTLALLTVRELDFPFESALQLSSRDFNETFKKIDRWIAGARPQGSRASE
jgi:hypothetical protein